MTTRLVLGDRGADVVALQQSLSTLRYTLVPDGIFGKKTLQAVQAYARDRTATGAPAWEVAAIHTEAARKNADAAAAPQLTSVGAWCGRSSLANPERDVAFAVAHNLTRLDIVVNDHSRARAPRSFDTFSQTKVARLAELARSRGVDVHVMSWLMPHARYIDEAAASLIPLCTRIGAASLQWDAEEPWTQSTRRLSYTAAASRIRDAFTDLQCPMGANAIGFTPVKKFGPLAELCDYIVPQVYATSTSSLDPETGPKKILERWRRSFGGKPIVMGLAAYKQNGIPGHTPDSAVVAAANAAASVGVREVIYWSLGAIRRSGRVASAIAKLVGPREAA